MSGLLWRYFLENDFESFRQLLEEATVANRQHTQKSNVGGQVVVPSLHVGSVGGAGTSPSTSFDSRKALGSRGGLEAHKFSFHDVTLGRTDVNRKDGKGMTLLHYAASSVTDNAFGFAIALIAHPLIDLYIQDLESGWTALHRAFYFGNITIARAILEREAQDAIGQGSSGAVVNNALSLVKIKDREGNGPYDLLTAIIKDRTLQHRDHTAREQHINDRDDEESEELDAVGSDSEDGSKRKALVTPYVDVNADELFTFGSNKNITLGLGNEDDRQYPERVLLRKPDHLFKRFYKEYIEARSAELASSNLQYSEKVRSQLRHSKELSDLPAMVRFRSSSIQDVQMSKFHSAVITNDPISNLYVCGHGLGGRLGTGGEKTQFNFTCVEDFPGKKRIVAVALGQDHSLAVTDQGEVFSWGSNAFGQLGLGMTKATVSTDDAIQLLPKQIFGILKREIVVGVAASRIHSVVHTSGNLYTFGKNDGQLGIVDAHAGSLEIQTVPRRVAASRFSCGIKSVCAIDRATVCLLENHEVHVFANYGITKLSFPLDGFTNYFLKKSFLATRYDETPNCIVKITGGGDTICSLSSAGEIFAVNVGQYLDPGSSSTTSTTNPTKIKAALSTPARIWSLKKGHMSARDVGVDQDGSIILSTEAGSVWRRARRPNLSSARGVSDKKSKEFKFSRVPGLTRVMAVRASGSGAYCAMRRDCDVTKSQIFPADKTIWNDLTGLLPFKNFTIDEDSDAENPTPRFWSKKPDALERLIAALSQSKDLEKDLGETMKSSPNERCENYDVHVCSTISEVRIPAHQFILSGRSRILRQAFAETQQTGSWTSELCTITSDTTGRMLLTFVGLDFLTLVDFVLYAYTDRFVGFWRNTKHAPQLVFRHRQVRAEVMKIASRLELRNLESAARKVAATADLSLDKDIELATMEPTFFQSGDALVELADGEALVHVDLVSRRCPFFQGLFQGRAGGRWLADRRNLLSGTDAVVSIDLKHIDYQVFQLVLRHIYADTGDELFDDIITKSLDEFLDIVLDVLSVANELMLDRLSQVCQMVLGQYVNVRNICPLLNAIAPSAITDFRDAGLEYLCLNLEAVLSTHLLDELDEDLLHELDAVVRDNQLASMPFAKSGRAEALLHEKHPELISLLDRYRQAKIDSINLQTKFSEHGAFFGTSFDPVSGDELSSTPARSKNRSRASAPTTPVMHPQSPPIDPSSSIAESSFRPRQQLFDLNTLRSVPAEVLPGSADRSPRPTFERNSPSTTFGMLPPAAQSESRLDIPVVSNATEESYEGNTGKPSPSPLARPWGATPLSSTKLGMEEIMQQASSRTSNISLGLASQAKPDDRAPGSFTTKISQKERRKLQQQQTQSDSLSSSPASGSSPWQNVSSRSKSSTRDIPSSSKLPSSPIFVSGERSVTTPQLTLRQTVANSPASGKQKEVVTPVVQTPSAPLPQRSVSTPQVARPSPLQSTPSSSASKPIQIQSVRHTPRSPNETSPTFYMHQSMADILSQQEAEKYAKKEAVAKRSLMEIQQEQEFLSWWDQESKRMLEEEAKAVRGGNERERGRGRGKGGQGRGKERAGKGRGRGKEKADVQLGTPDRTRTGSDQNA